MRSGPCRMQLLFMVKGKRNVDFFLYVIDCIFVPGEMYRNVDLFVHYSTYMWKAVVLMNEWCGHRTVTINCLFMNDHK